MPQDQGPTQEPPTPKADQIIIAHSLGELTKLTEGLPYSDDINYNGLLLENLIKKWKGRSNAWEELKGKKVLDLGAGSALHKEMPEPGHIKWYPHFARLCAVNGAKVTAVDKLPQTGPDVELFHSVAADLLPIVMEGRLAEILDEKEYDVVHSASFVGVNADSDLLVRLRSLGIKEENFERKFFEQCASLLAEGGVMFLDQSDSKGEAYYTKKEGKLVRL